ncbi:MAG: DUF2891 domain-containing protein [Candidatus Limnocylindrales bacterium]|jgi:Protein of unknown function (DUF2891)|nr:DUF2891 domain-containing protein [Candidatus Limnocylindrales bacterium]
MQKPVTNPPVDRSALLRANAASYTAVALANIGREFPADVWHIVRGPDDLPARPRDRTPVFYGSYDWHSSVEMHWLLVRLLRAVPEAIPAGEIRVELESRFSAAALAAEARFIANPDNRNRERPYGWGWGLALVHELAAWDDPDARRWSARFDPFRQALEGNFLGWLPLATYPVRHGVHANSAFAISRALPCARDRAAAGEPGLLDALVGACDRWYAADADCPGAWEPSGFDFLSPALTEAELMAQLLPGPAFGAWLDRFLPGLAAGEPRALFTPAVVSDASDGHIAHLHGLNASRAWCWRRLAEALPPGDPRSAVARDAMARHAAAALPHAVGDDYMVDHWLAAYAVLLLA